MSEKSNLAFVNALRALPIFPLGNIPKYERTSLAPIHQNSENSESVEKEDRIASTLQKIKKLKKESIKDGNSFDNGDQIIEDLINGK